VGGITLLVQHTRARHLNISNFSLFLALAVALLLLAALYTGIFNVQPPTTSTDRYQTFYSPHYGYSIAYPTDWQIVDQTGQGVFSATSKQQPQPDQGGTNFSQRKLLTPAEETAPAAGFSKIDVIAYELDTNLGAQDFMLARVGPMPQGKLSQLQLDGKDAVRIDVVSSAVLDNHLDSTTYSNVYITNGHYGYIIAGFASPSVFNHIINSLRFDR
jgi:hypothetical protein